MFWLWLLELSWRPSLELEHTHTHTRKMCFAAEIWQIGSSEWDQTVLHHRSSSSSSVRTRGTENSIKQKAFIGCCFCAVLQASTRGLSERCCFARASRRQQGKEKQNGEPAQVFPHTRMMMLLFSVPVLLQKDGGERLHSCWEAVRRLTAAG